jgi:hypothetical protein
MTDQRGAWRTSSYTGDGQACVEVSLTSERALIRDTKNREGGTIRLPGAVWSALLAHVKQTR